MISKPSRSCACGDAQRRVGEERVPVGHGVEAGLAQPRVERGHPARRVELGDRLARVTRSRISSTTPNRPMLRTAPTLGCLAWRCQVAAHAPGPAGGVADQIVVA